MATPTRVRSGLPHRFGGGPDPDLLRQWVDSGLTDTQIAQLVGDMYGGDTPSHVTVINWRKKHGIVRRHGRQARLDHSKYRPWRVRVEHTGDAIERRLYDYSRLRQGRRLDEKAQQRLDEFLDFLARHEVVVSYDPETEDGWFFVERDPERDDPDSIIRAPEAD